MALVVSVALASCGGAAGGGGHLKPGVIRAVGAESQYANVISQIGGRYVSVTAIMDNPNTDPHEFEASPSIAQTVSAAKLIVQNGVGYDDFMNKIEAASPSSSRRVVSVQSLLHLPDSTSNPHLWYDPQAVEKVAAEVARELSAIDRGHSAYFTANLGRFDSSMKKLFSAIKAFKRRYSGTTVATTEPVADYLLGPLGARNLTPWNLQADIMNGVDPTPQAISLENNLLSGHRVQALLYNQQVTDTLTQSFLKRAARYHVPVVGVYETMPSGFSYQTWMLAEVEALQRAVTSRRSTTTLQKR